MNSSYYSWLNKLKEQTVSIHRANAVDVAGEVDEVNEGGCVINAYVEGVMTQTFVAYEHIRGVVTTGYDLRFG